MPAPEETKARRIVLGSVGLRPPVYTVLDLQAFGSQVSGRAERPLGGADRSLGFCHSLHPGWLLTPAALGAGSHQLLQPLPLSLPICSVLDLRQRGPGELLQGLLLLPSLHSAWG
jgi:hypothetical protein